MEKVLTWNRAITPQETGWSCGPAATQVVLDAAGVHVSEQELIRQIGTHQGGTDHTGWIVDRALKVRVPQAGYVVVWLPQDPPTGPQRDALWEHLTRSINAGWGLVVNWVSPPNNRPQPVRGSERLQYPAGGTVFHYVAYMGWAEDAQGRAVFVADSGFRPFMSWISFEQACTLVPPKSYGWASSSAAVVAPPVVVPPVVTPPAPSTDRQLDTLMAAMAPTGVTRERARELLPGFLDGAARAQITNVNRMAMWCAQLGHESAGLRYMREIHDGSNYEGRQDLGNTQPGDGIRFAGRGPIQITGRHNYTQVSRWAFEQGYVSSPTFFVDNPTELESPRWGFLGAAWYWVVARPRINEMSDARDLVGVTRAINGGTHGLQDRTERWNRCLAMGDRLLELRGASPPPTEEGFLMALTADEQREVLENSRAWARDRRPSLSPLRHLGSEQAGAVSAIHRLDFADANIHILLCIQLAMMGDAEHLALLREIASAKGNAQYPDRQHDAAFAQAVLDYAEAHGAPEGEARPLPPPFQCLVNGSGLCAQGGEAHCSITGSGVCVAAGYLAGG